MAEKQSIGVDLTQDAFNRIIVGFSTAESLSLHALVNIVGMSYSDVAKAVGLTRARIGHFVNLAHPISLRRRHDFANLLREAIQTWEERIANFEGDPNAEEHSDSHPNALELAENMLEMCRVLLTEDEADLAAREADAA